MAEETFLVPLEEYLKVGLHIGTKFKTKAMAPFIYKVRPDGLSVLNVQEIDHRIKLASNMLNKFKPEEILVVCRRENGWRAVELFSKLTKINAFIGRYPPGVLTNISLENFQETKLILVVDPWPDKNTVNDGAKLGIPVIALCDTNNDSKNIDLIIPCNNKGKKSLGLLFWILSREYLLANKTIKNEKEMKFSLEDFTAD